MFQRQINPLSLSIHHHILIVPKLKGVFLRIDITRVWKVYPGRRNHHDITKKNAIDHKLDHVLPDGGFVYHFQDYRVEWFRKN
jgi:hypothetical protein